MIFIILLIFTGTYNWVSTMTSTRLASYLPSGSILYQFDMVYITAESRRGNGLMSSALDFIFQVERSGFQTWSDDCVVFLGKTPLFYTTFLHPGVKMGTGKVSGQTWWNVGGTTNLDIDWHPIQGKGGGCIILLDTSCYGRWGKYQLDGPLKYILNPFLPTCTPDNL